VLQTKNVHFNHTELWNVSLECKSLILSLLAIHPHARPNPIHAMRSFWFDNKEVLNEKLLFTEADRLLFIERMKKCLNMTPMEKLLRRSIAKKAVSNNLD